MKSVALPATPVLGAGMTARNLVLLSAAILLCIGVVMVASASLDAPEKANNGFIYAFMIKQFVFLTIGLCAGFVATQIPIDFYKNHNGKILIMAGIAITLVLFIGREVNGSVRWISVGPISIQPSEIVKFALVMYMADYLIRFQGQVRKEWKGFFKPVIVVSPIVGLLMMEPDFGASMVSVSAVLGMLFLAGAPLRKFFTMVAAVLAVGALAVVFAPYRMKRMIAFTNPWEDQFSSGYQLVQSLIAFGRGEIWGVGLGNSIQKLSFLPEAHTDFVLAIFAEEFGLVGVCFLVTVFFVLVMSAIRIGQNAERKGMLYSAYLAYGIALLIGVQALVNIGVNMGLLPTKGLTLPLVSYGGSSLVVVLVMLGTLLRIDTESQRALHSVAQNSTHSAPQSATQRRAEPALKGGRS